MFVLLIDIISEEGELEGFLCLVFVFVFVFFLFLFWVLLCGVFWEVFFGWVNLFFFFYSLFIFFFSKGKYGVENLVDNVVKEVYEIIDNLKEEMEFILQKKWVGLPLEMEGSFGGGGEGGLEEGGERTKSDYEYLVKMKVSVFVFVEKKYFVFLCFEFEN